jgi:hypothetical protein
MIWLRIWRRYASEVVLSRPILPVILWARLETRHMRGAPDTMRDVVGEMGVVSGSPVAV